LDARAQRAGTAPLSRLSAVMCVVVSGGALAALIALAWVWLSPRAVVTLLAPRLGLAWVPIALDGWTRAAGFLVSMIPMGVLLYLLHQAYQLFDAYRRGLVFTDTAPLRLRRIGLCMVALGVLRPVTATALGVLLTLANPSGQHILAIGVSIDDYMIAACGGLVLAIGHVLVEAKRIADENGQII
jgi:hypothetical protein